MSYLTVITLEQAKNYLRVDDTLTEDDDQITSMINMALNYVEKHTQNYVYQRDETFIAYSGILKSYAYPVVAVVDPVDDTLYTADRKTLYTNYWVHSGETTDITLTVGWETVAEVPDGLRQVAFEIIDIYYYGNETGKSMDDLSQLSIDILNQHKRFLI